MLLIACLRITSLFGASFEIFADLESPRAGNDRPIIGVLTQELPDSLNSYLPAGHNFTSYIASSYIKYVEGAGARAAPVIIGKDKEEYKQIFSSLNGFLLPGGAVSLFTSGYAEVSKIFYDLAIEANMGGDFFPVWGTCLGFEMLVLLAANGQPYRQWCNSWAQPLPLEFLSDWEKSELFKQAPSDVLEAITSLPVTMNFHHWCLTMENFTKYDMGEFWQPLSVNTDLEGLEFISTLEAKNLPIFATQWHPEKNPYEWAPKYPQIPHSREAVNVAFYTAEFLVELARKSTHQFPDRKTEEAALIYNYQPFYSGIESIDFGFQQVYLF